MKTRVSLFALVLWTVMAPSAMRPNILFIHMEDMGVEIPAYGDNTVATPNLDRLTSDGVIFERAHVTAATCAASRGTLLSGLYPHQNGIMGFVKTRFPLPRRHAQLRARPEESRLRHRHHLQGRR